MEREVVIVGAGPSGSVAAIALAKKGRDVLLLDRQEFPRDKACGDGIPSGAVEILYSLGLEERFREANFYPVDSLLLSSPREYVLEAALKPGKRFGASSYVVPRLRFDALIQEYAVDSGVEFINAPVKGAIVEDNQVKGVVARVNGAEEEIRAKVVIGADGVTSTIARTVRPDIHKDSHRAVALRCYIQDIEELPHKVEFYLYRAILPGYAWIFPLGEGQANLGLGMRLDKFRESNRTLEEMVDVFLEMPSIKKRLSRGGDLQDIMVWQLNFGSQDMKRAYNGALLIGDAAGLINPLTGGGIHNGLQSAIMAADVIEKGLTDGDVSYKRFQEYESILHERMYKAMRKSYNIQRSLHHFPIWVDMLARLGGSNSTLAQTFVSKL
ncbi:MAG: NAD(P)/FAD-dependent oxidoreductase [Anaerolineae bacterium]|nr:MAG: NAD(P)/FAD-dependent oxidoreductase [Anaerolineae bacterium]